MITNILDATTGNWSGIGTGTATAKNNLHPGCWPPCSAVTKLIYETRRRVRSACRLDKPLNRVCLFKMLSSPINGIKNVVTSSINMKRLETDKKKEFICVSFANLFRLSSVKCLAKLLFRALENHTFGT
jgi:hypothetical protein